jgi:ribosomal protein S18 acetylase RimI-like enzyme
MAKPDIRLVPKTDDETARWLPVAMSAYERARTDAGDTPEQAAVARRASEEQFFPDGRLIDGHFLFTVKADGEDAGWLWIGPSSDPDTWWVWDIEVHDAFRRRGIGRETMLLAEDVARSQGAAAIRLNVFAYNDSAIRLYDGLGYATASMHMQKRL